MVKRLVLEARRGARKRVSLLVVELRAASNWLRPRFDRGPGLFMTNRKCFRLRDQPRQPSTGRVAYPTRPVPRRMAAAASMRSTNSPVRTTRTRTQDARMPDARTDPGHWTTDIGHRDARTPDGRTLDTCRTSDAGHVPDIGHWTGGRRTRGRLRRTRAGRPRHGRHPDTPWHRDTAGTANRVAVGGTRGARQQ
jgi:hypothetical protein